MLGFFHSLLHWIESEHVLIALEYFGGLLMAPEFFAVILGKRVVEQVSQFLLRLRTSLSSENARKIAKQITFGPVSWVALLLCAIAFGWVVVSEARDSQLWRLLGANDLNFFRWLIKASWLVLFKPACCLGVAIGVYITRSAKARARFGRWSEQFTARTYQAQMRRDLIQQLTVAIIGSVVLIAFYIGLFAGNLLLVIVFHLMEKPIRALGAVLDQDRLRRSTAIIGFVMFTIPFAVRMSH